MSLLLKKLDEKWDQLLDFLDRPAWKNRILFYSIIFASIAVSFLFIFFIFNLIFSDFSILNNTAYTHHNTTHLSNMGFFDNERYLLSALVQSLAATIALVITLSLVAVQLAAQSYSARVIEVYKRSPDMWILLGIYIITIFYGLGLIKIIGLGVLSDYMEGAIFVAYFMGFFAFACLIPYIWNTLASMNPSTLIQLLAEDITTERILNYLRRNGQRGDKDPVLPIIDVVNSALIRKDDETVRNGILEIKNVTMNIFECNHFEETEEANVSKFIIQHIEMIGIQAADKSNENSSISVILALDDIKRKATECKLKKATDEAIKALENMQLKVLRQRFENATEQIIKIHKTDGIKELEARQTPPNMPPVATQILGQIGMRSIEQNMNLSAMRATEALGELGTKAAEEKKDFILLWIIGVIQNLGLKAANKKMDYTAGTAAKALENIVTPLLEIKQGYLLERLLNYLYNISIEAVNNELEAVAETTTRALGTLGIGVLEEDEIIVEILEKLENLTMQMIKTELEYAVGTAANELGNIGMRAAEQKRETIVIKAAKALGNIGIRAAGQKLVLPELYIVEALKNGGIKAAENGLEKATEEYTKILEELMTEIEDIKWTIVDSNINEALDAIEKAK